MATGLKLVFTDPVTKISADPLHTVGEIRFENGKKYMYTQADDAITQYQVCVFDIAASATGKKVTPSGTAGQPCVGVAEVAVTDEYYFWLTIGGFATAIVKTGVAVNDPLTCTATAGALGKAAEADSAAAYKNVRAFAAEANASGSDANALIHMPM